MATYICIRVLDGPELNGQHLEERLREVQKILPVRQGEAA